MTVARHPGIDGNETHLSFRTHHGTSRRRLSLVSLGEIERNQHPFQ